jgi:hypothetical protein
MHALGFYLLFHIIVYFMPGTSFQLLSKCGLRKFFAGLVGIATLVTSLRRPWAEW